MAERGWGGLRHVVRDFQKWQRKWLDSLVAVGVLAVLGGAFALSLPSADTVAHTLGAAVIGAGLSVLIGAFTGKRAAYEQYAREANLRRRDTVYGPLHAEALAALQAFERAANKESPYPGVIVTSVAQSPTNYGLPIPVNLSLAWWATFRADYRRDDFTLKTQHMLDALIDAAQAYNAAIEALRAPTVEILARSMGDHVEQIRESTDFRAWEVERARPERRNAPVGVFPPLEHDWFTMFADFPRAYDRTFGQQTFAWWTDKTAVLGWTLADAPERLCDAIERQYDRSSPAFPPPPREWIKSVLTTAWSELQSHPTYQQARAAETTLMQWMIETEHMLKAGLTEIQDRYEGGRPIV